MASWGRPNLTSKGRPNLTSEGRPWKLVSGRPQHVLRTSPRQPRKHVVETMWCHLLDVPKLLFTFLSELTGLSELSERLTKSI